MENRKTAISGEKTEFVLMRAEAYTVPETVNRCYFFNPFSVESFHKVMTRILESCYENPREIFLFLRSGKRVCGSADFDFPVTGL